MSTVYLVRHGRTALNADDRLRGHADPPLDQIGESEVERMASALAAELDGREVHVVLSSPLQRARTTAQVIAAAVGSHVELSHDVDDRDYGSWTGHPRSEVVREFGSVDAAPGVEPVEAVLARAEPALERLAHGGVTVVVTHDAVIKPLLGRIDPSIAFTVPTASWARLEHDGTGWSVAAVDRQG